MEDQFNYLKFLSDTAHDPPNGGKALGIALKNGVDMIQSKGDDIVNLTDFVVIEQCQEFNECGAYSPFNKVGKAAFQIE